MVHPISYPASIEGQHEPGRSPLVISNLHARYARQNELIQIGRDVVHRAGVVLAERSIHEARDITALSGTQHHSSFVWNHSNLTMTSQSEEPTKNAAGTIHTSEQDFAIGSQEEITELQSLRSYTWRSFFRSVLLQMILFGL